MKPVELDLRRDLPKVREQFEKVVAASRIRKCEYKGPCVIGAMVSPNQRHVLDALDTRSGSVDIGSLIDEGFVTAPADQVRDLKSLQTTFDYGKDWRRVLRRVERKYLRGDPA